MTDPRDDLLKSRSDAFQKLEKAFREEIVPAAALAMNDFMQSEAGAAYFQDVLGGMGVTHISDAGVITRVAPADFLLPPPPITTRKE